MLNLTNYFKVTNILIWFLQLLQFDLWNVKPSNLWDWNSLKERIIKHGLFNSLVTIISNTEIESKILGTMNSIEPLDTNVKHRHISFEGSKSKEIQVIARVQNS